MFFFLYSFRIVVCSLNAIHISCPHFKHIWYTVPLVQANLIPLELMGALRAPIQIYLQEQEEIIEEEKTFWAVSLP